LLFSLVGNEGHRAGLRGRVKRIGGKKKSGVNGRGRKIKGERERNK
jgi:hypothetical protein